MKSALRPHFFPLLALLILLGLTACGAHLPLGSFNLPLALFIGSTKTTIVALFFMELKRADTLHRIVALVGLAWLIILFMLALADYTSRFPGHLLN